LEIVEFCQGLYLLNLRTQSSPANNKSLQTAEYGDDDPMPTIFAGETSLPFEIIDLQNIKLENNTPDYDTCV
jgi:hypothetical protein